MATYSDDIGGHPCLKLIENHVLLRDVSNVTVMADHRYERGRYTNKVVVNMTEPYLFLEDEASLGNIGESVHVRTPLADPTMYRQVLYYNVSSALHDGEWHG